MSLLIVIVIGVVLILGLLVVFSYMDEILAFLKQRAQINADRDIKIAEIKAGGKPKVEEPTNKTDD